MSSFYVGMVAGVIITLLALAVVCEYACVQIAAKCTDCEVRRENA